jgi:hypothetical protein
LIDRSRRSGQVGIGAPGTGLRHTYAAILSSDRATVVRNLTFESCLSRFRTFQGICIGPPVDLEQKITLLDQLIVLDMQMHDWSIDDGGDPNKISDHFSIVCARIYCCLS